jgi:2'-5' RNA ligase
LRLFVAFDMPTQLMEALESGVVEPLRPVVPGARWTRPEGRHLTVKFLGEVADERVRGISRALAHAARGHAPFEAALERIGGFPSLRRPRVLWVGVGEGADAMARVAADVDEGLGGEGFQREARPFAAHLTLARFKVPAPVGQLPEVDVPSRPFPVSEVVLFRSELRREGARYTAVERFPLAGGQFRGSNVRSC